MDPMPLPHWLTRVNLVVTNRITQPIACRLPWFGLLEHIGRRSGTARRTPINIFRRGDRYVIALTYGPDVQWLRNVQAADGCRICMLGRWVPLTSPRRFRDPRRRAVPFVVRWALWVLNVTEFVELRRTSR
jgi:deazaflavin-dependent oxidoreductase (nitroreductase family)